MLEKLSNKKVVLEDNEDTIFKPTHLIDNRQEKYKQKIFQILQQEVIEGDLDLKDLNFITNLGNVKLVKGNLDLENSSITSLSEGLKIEGYLNLTNTKITSLPEGLEVKGSLFLQNTKITSLPAGLVVKGNLYLKNTPISKNPELIKKYRKLYKII